MTNITFCKPRYLDKRRIWNKTSKAMRLTVMLIIASSLGVSAKSYSHKMNLALKNSPIGTALEKIGQQSGSSFLWNAQAFEGLPSVSISVHGASLEEALKACLKRLPLTYDIHGKVVYIECKLVSLLQVKPYIKPLLNVIVGSVTDSASGKPLAGVTILLILGLGTLSS